MAAQEAPSVDTYVPPGEQVCARQFVASNIDGCGTRPACALAS